MRMAFWFAALFGAAVAAAFFAGSNQAVVTLFWPPYRVDLALNMAILLLLLAFVGLYFLLRGVMLIFSLPSQARRWRGENKERAMHAALVDAMGYFLAGRFLRANRAAERALRYEEVFRLWIQSHETSEADGLLRAGKLRAMAFLVLAESAQSLGNKSARDLHVAQALKAAEQPETGDLREGVVLRAARWALDDRDPQVALNWLGQLSQAASRRTLVLRMRLRTLRQAGLTAPALQTVRLLKQYRAFSAHATLSIERGLVFDLLNDARDSSQLEQNWRLLSPAERAMPEVVVHAATRLVALHGNPALARQWLLEIWEPILRSCAKSSHIDDLGLRFVGALGDALDGLDADWLARLEKAAHAAAHQPYLQYLAGLACLHRQLWGKAQQMLAQALPRLEHPEFLRKTWCALAILAEQRGDAAAAHEAYKRAAGFEVNQQVAQP